MFDRTARSHSLAAAGQRERSAVVKIAPMTPQENQDPLADALRVMRSAGGCNDCFGDVLDLRLNHASAGLPQVRWIGESYWNSRPRIAIVLINPAAARFAGQAMQREASICRRFYDGNPYDEVRRHFREKAARGNKWLCWYRDQLGLDIEKVTHLNIALCATQGDKYPLAMLKHCFAKHTLHSLTALSPEIVLLSGRRTHRFAAAIENALRGVRIIKMIHYANRASKEAKLADIRRVRSLLERS